MKGWNYENEQYTKLPAHMKHLPLFTRHFDYMSWIFRALWGFFLKVLAFKVFIRLKVVGDFKNIYKEHPRLIIISNHTSHLDAVSIAAAIPFKYWVHLYITAAKDYWFRNPVFSFFSKHCLGAIPIDRKDKSGEAVKLCMSLLKGLDRIWLIMFPEGTRSYDGTLNPFKKGVSIFSKNTDTPILFLFIEGGAKLMPKGSAPKPGSLKIHIGPVQPPAEIEEIQANYEKWIKTIELT